VEIQLTLEYYKDDKSSVKVKEALTVARDTDFREDIRRFSAHSKADMKAVSVQKTHQNKTQKRQKLTVLGLSDGALPFTHEAKSKLTG